VIAEDIQFRIDLDPGLRPVHADPGQLHQVLMNLAINARDAMPQGGTLSITTANALEHVGRRRNDRAEGPAPCVVLTVSDSGCGMTPEVRARVFEPFYSTKAPGQGTGLGLSMVYRVIAESGGRIAIDSEPDRGTTITIHLPVAETKRDGTIQPPATPEALQGTETILLVEDEAAIRQLIRKILQRYGYQVLEASDVNHALDLAENHPGPIDLLLSDIVMPMLSGPDLAQKILRHRGKVRVLYMSGFSTRPAGVGAGVAVLEKPFTPGRLALSVRECLSVKSR
jgi:two-component system cell cycle sensor histidine kinase/response regulator CckA